MTPANPDAPRASRLFRGAGRELAGLLLPAQCPGCGAWDEVLCPECASLAEGPPLLAEFALDSASVLPGPHANGVGGHAVPIAALGPYDAELRRIIVSAKHSRAFGAEGFLARAGEVLGSVLGEALASGSSREEGEEGRDSEPFWIVPAPPSWRRRLLGRQVTPLLASGVARGIARTSGFDTRVVEAVGTRPGASSQAGRGALGRRRERRGTMRARTALPPPGRLVLVDDVLTTGATMRELARASGGAAAIAVLARVAPVRYDESHDPRYP